MIHSSVVNIVSIFMSNTIFSHNNAGDVLKLRLESSTFTVKGMLNRVQQAIPGFPNPSEHRPNEEDEEPVEEDPFGSSQAIVDLLVKYTNCQNRNVEVVQREEELLQELLARTKKERMQLQYMGARKHQTASRNLIADTDGLP